MIRLTKKQLDDKVGFINNYIGATNAATGSKLDANANITSKNIATLAAELNKDINIQIKRKLVCDEITELYGEDVARNYIEQLEKHEIYCHDESHLAPYCVAISLYPFLLNGLQDFGGEAKAPKHLSSYNGGFVNLIFALASQFAGAVACVEYLLGFDHFARKDYGDNYLEEQTHLIEQEFQQTIYALNQPASARNFQCPFFNTSIFDEHYFNTLFGHFTFPDGSKPDWKSFDKLQKFFCRWFNKERTKATLTFPVLTFSLLNDGTTMVDKEYQEFAAIEMSRGNAFFTYTSDTVDSLSSCCRLRNGIADQINDFSYSLGAGGVMTGSMNVITLNVNRFVQDVCNSEPYEEAVHLPIIQYLLRQQILTMHKYLLGFKALYTKFEKNGMLPAYTAGFISLDKQYLTIGINGLLEAAEYLGYTPNNNEAYKHFISTLLKEISDTNKETCKEHSGLKINTEIVPAENLGVKFAMWDKKDGYVVTRDCYNSYLYKVEDDEISILDKFILHGNETTKYLDGGSALHINLEDYPTSETCKKLMDVAVQTGCNYFCFNVKITICDDCGYIDKQTLSACKKCGSRNVAYATRVIGYLRRVDNFAVERQKEEALRYYHFEGNDDGLS